LNEAFFGASFLLMTKTRLEPLSVRTAFAARARRAKILFAARERWRIVRASPVVRIINFRFDCERAK
jgi:hypothetical protein